jgi:hypothetical protein
MRKALLSLILVVPFLGACGTSALRVGGTVTYAMTPALDRSADSSGTLPLEILYCPGFHQGAELATNPAPQPTLVRLGDGCVLDLDHGGGTCDLPTRGGPVRVSVEKVAATFTPIDRAWNDRRWGPPFNVFVSGTAGSQQVAYRFTGWDIQTGNGDDCKTAAQAVPERPVVAAASSQGEFNQAYWSVWRNGATDDHP